MSADTWECDTDQGCRNPGLCADSGDCLFLAGQAHLQGVDRMTRPTLPSMPMEIQEWCWHMDHHITELDLRHAGLALRVAWPHVSKWLRENVGHAPNAGKAFGSPLRDIDRILNDPSLSGPDSLDMIEGIVRAALMEAGS